MGRKMFHLSPMELLAVGVAAMVLVYFQLPGGHGPGHSG